MPEATRAGIKAVGPGRGMIVMPAAMARRMRMNPGSEIPGVPESVTRAASRSEHGHNLLRLDLLLGTVVADDLFSDPQVVQQLQRITAVLGDDEIDLVQNGDGPLRHVSKVADRRGNDI